MKRSTVIWKLLQGEYPVLYADVWAEITRPLADGITDTVNLTLKDDGVVTDIIKDDGIYSGNFFQFSDKGRYSIKGELSRQNPNLDRSTDGP